MIIANFISYILVVIGSLNWGLVGIFNFNLVDSIFGAGSIISSIIYILVAIAGIWLLVSPWFSGNMFDLGCKYKHHDR